MNYAGMFERVRCALGQEGLLVRDEDIVDEWCGEDFADFAFHIKGIKGWRFGVWYGEIVGWWYGEPDDKDFIEAFGWKYKLLKHFKRKDKK